ncbi:conserved Plasmodium protein, unknown function, partial [Plasmodium malariae]
NASVDVLLRRPNCKNRITEIFYLALENDIQIEDFLSIVNIININYRKLIEQCAKKGNTITTMSVTKTNRKIIQPLESLLKNLGGKTLITEKDIVTDAFHTFMIKKYSLNKKETLFNFSLNVRELEKNKKDKKKSVHIKNETGEKYMLKYKIKKKSQENDKRSGLNISSEMDQTRGDEKNSALVDGNSSNGKKGIKDDGSSGNIRNGDIGSGDIGIGGDKNARNRSVEYTKNVNCIIEQKDIEKEPHKDIKNEYKLKLNYSELNNMPIFLIYVLEYMKSLLYLNIIPNRILQTFIFDLCIFFKQDNCLRQLLQFYVISDSIEVTKRLFHYWKLTEHPWAYQYCLDMSLRLKEYEMAIHLFLCAKKYLKIINFLRNYNLVDYPISVILQAIENDFDSPDKYIIFNQVLLSLNNWIMYTVLATSEYSEIDTCT